VSLAGQRRRLQRLEKASGSKEPTLEQLVRQVDREDEAIRSVTAFARALAGTDQVVAPSLSPSPVACPEGIPSQASPASSWNARPVWTKDIRPGPRDLLTWEEAMRVPWIEGEDAIER
jgi:hypothetical protein